MGKIKDTLSNIFTNENTMIKEENEDKDIAQDVMDNVNNEVAPRDIYKEPLASNIDVVRSPVLIGVKPKEDGSGFDYAYGLNQQIAEAPLAVNSYIQNNMNSKYGDFVDNGVYEYTNALDDTLENVYNTRRSIEYYLCENIYQSFSNIIAIGNFENTVGYIADFNINKYVRDYMFAANKDGINVPLQIGELQDLLYFSRPNIKNYRDSIDTEKSDNINFEADPTTANAKYVLLYSKFVKNVYNTYVRIIAAGCDKAIDEFFMNCNEDVIKLVSTVAGINSESEDDFVFQIHQYIPPVKLFVKELLRQDINYFIDSRVINRLCYEVIPHIVTNNNHDYDPLFFFPDESKYMERTMELAENKQALQDLPDDITLPE